MVKWFALGTSLTIFLLIFMNTKKIESSQKYSVTLGQFKVIALLDGYVDLHLQNIIADQRSFDHPYLHAKNPTDTIQIPVNVYLIDTGVKKILIDVGLAGAYDSQTGFLLESLKAAGYKSEDITDILITHLHPDHVAGLLTKNNQKAFENAQLYISKADIDYWVYEQQLYPELAPFIAQLIAPYDLRTFEPNQQLFEGITVFSTPGHSPGHSGFLCKSENQNLLIWGDIVHIYELQFINPNISLKDDTDQAQAIESRKKLFEYLSKNNILIGGAHLPFPGLGHVIKINDASYQWKSL